MSPESGSGRAPNASWRHVVLVLVVVTLLSWTIGPLGGVALLLAVYVLETRPGEYEVSALAVLLVLFGPTLIRAAGVIP